MLRTSVAVQLSFIRFWYDFRDAREPSPEEIFVLDFVLVKYYRMMMMMMMMMMMIDD